MTLLVTWLWQGLAIAGVTASAVRAMPRLNAATRHAIWWLALAGVLAIPVGHGLAAIIPEPPSVPELTGSVVARVLILPAVPAGVVTGAAALWAMIAVVSVLRIARGCRTLRRLRRASLPFDASREARLTLWIAARDGGHRAAELRTTDGMTGACALGLGRPTILVSRVMADALDDESLDEIVMHEQAHLDRYDDWSQLLLVALRSVAGLHPAVRFLARRVEVDCEAACDDRVVSRTGAPRRYASSLLTVAGLQSAQAHRLELAAGVPAATATASMLRARIGRLLDPARDRSARLARAASLASAIAVAVALVASVQARPLVTFLESVVVTAPPAAGAAAAVAAARFAPAIAADRPPETASRANSHAARGEGAQTARRAFAGLERPKQADPMPAALFHGMTGTSPDESATASLDGRALAAETHALALGMVVPSPQTTAASSPAAHVPAPWEALATSATSAASDLARAATTTGARAQNAGMAIGRLVTRASKAGASVF